MRGQYYILERQQRIVWWRWLLVEHVEAGAKQLIVCECAGECGLVDHRAAAGVDDDRFGLHRGKLVRADHVAGRREIGRASCRARVLIGRSGGEVPKPSVSRMVCG